VTECSERHGASRKKVVGGTALLMRFCEANPGFIGKVSQFDAELHRSYLEESRRIIEGRAKKRDEILFSTNFKRYVRSTTNPNGFLEVVGKNPMRYKVLLL
jgi:hypothetical protein